MRWKEALRVLGQIKKELQNLGINDVMRALGSLRPHHPERARSHLISEAKQGWAWLVLGWESLGVKQSDVAVRGGPGKLGRGNMKVTCNTLFSNMLEIFHNKKLQRKK